MATKAPQIVKKTNNSCDYCGKEFSKRKDLLRHIVTHTGEKNFRCDICEKRFSRKAYLSLHMGTHTGDKKFECDICRKGFSQNSALNTHMVTHTGEKNFSCNICGKEFSQKSILNRHIFTHTREKNFSCNICGKEFSQKSTLNRHMITHTGEKNFSCEICGKEFSHKCHVTRHMVTHTNEKNYKCDVCEKEFSLKLHLTQHITKHTDFDLVSPHFLLPSSIKLNSIPVKQQSDSQFVRRTNANCNVNKVSENEKNNVYEMEPTTTDLLRDESVTTCTLKTGNKICEKELKDNIMSNIEYVTVDLLKTENEIHRNDSGTSNQVFEEEDVKEQKYSESASYIFIKEEPSNWDLNFGVQDDGKCIVKEEKDFDYDSD